MKDTSVRVAESWDEALASLRTGGAMHIAAVRIRALSEPEPQVIGYGLMWSGRDGTAWQFDGTWKRLKEDQ